MEKPKGKAIMTDLSTMYSWLAVFKNGRPEVTSNSNMITFPVVAFTDKERLIGDGAETQRKLYPHYVVFNAKRFIGIKWDDPIVQENISN